MEPDGGLVGELLSKHKNSTQASSEHLCAVLRAILEVLQAEGMQPTPPALFAAVMAALEKPDSLESPETVTAMCTLLAVTLSRMPDAILRSKFSACSVIVGHVVNKMSNQASALRAAVDCLGQITCALDPGDWPSAAAPFNQLLGLALDSRPKVRRAAQAALAGVLANIRDTPAINPASASIVKVSQQILPGPEAALKAVAAAAPKKRQEAEALLATAVSNALHLLNLLKLTLPLLTGSAAATLADLLPKMYHLQQPLLARQATDVLAVLCGSSSSRLAAKPLARLLTQVMDTQAAWQTSDANATLSLLRLLEAGFSRLRQLDPQAATDRLYQAFATLVPQLAAIQEDVRFASGQVMKNLIAECVDGGAVELPGGGPSPLQGVFTALQSSLAASHQESWPAALSVAEELFSAVGPAGAGLAEGLLQRLGSMCAAAAEAAEEEPEEDGTRDGDGDVVGRAAKAALGAAIRSLGPAAVLHVLPLNLQNGQASSQGPQARTWLLPLLRHHVSGAPLGFWGTSLLPIARALGNRGAEAVAANSNAARLVVLQARALETQIWNTLPAFCNWPTDMPQAFRAHARDIGAAFQNREDLRPPICTALERLCIQNRAALQAAGATEGIGYADPARDEDDEDGSNEAAEQAASIPDTYTLEFAQQNVAALRAFAKNWMPLLFNAFVATPPGARAHIDRAIAAYSALCDAGTMATFFKTVVRKLIKVVEDSKAEVPVADAVQEGGENPSERRCTFMELALCLAPGLDVSAVNVLYRAAAPALQEKDQAVQKRAYKLLAYILESRPNYARQHFQDILDALLGGLSDSMSAAKRYRLRCLQAAILMLQRPEAPDIQAGDEDMVNLSQEERRKQVVASLLSEIVLCIKEVNQRTRVAAYQLLVGLAHAMHEAEPPQVPLANDTDVDGAEDSAKGGLHTLFTMVLGGLVGATPHMVSASVMALARLLYEFAPQLEAAAPQLLPVVLLMLRSKSREVVKSVLGFIKVCTMRLPVEMLEQHLGAILEGILLWSEDSKNKFRLKVRVILERLARRLDYDLIASHIPEGDRKLLVHIRKEQLRKRRLKTQSEAGSQMDVDDDEGGKSRAGKSARTARTEHAGRSEWAQSGVFSSDDEAAPMADARSRKESIRTAGPSGRGAVSQRGKGQQAKQRRLPGGGIDGDPLDLLDASTSRTMMRSAAGKAPATAEAADFPLGDGGRMVINEEDAPPRRAAKPKRKRGGGIDHAASDDSDFDDLHGIAGATAALRLGGKGAGSVAAGSTLARTAARSTAGGRSTTGARSVGGRSAMTASGRGKEHSGERFAAAKKGAGGDVKGTSRVEPYAYWPLDRKMLNRRKTKQGQAKRGLANIVDAAKQGAAKGAKAKVKAKRRRMS